MPEIDQRNRFDEEVFTYMATKEGKVLIYWHRKHVSTLKGDKAHKFLARSRAWTSARRSW